MVPVAEVRLDVAGLGIILIGHAAKLIPHGSDFFSDNLSDADSIVDIFSEGELTGFGTGSSGIFLVRLYIGPPGEDELNNWGAGIELWFVTNDGSVELRDLYDFMCWEEVPAHSPISIRPGVYRVHVFSRRPESGVVGGHQEVAIFLEQRESMPRMKFSGIPLLLPGVESH